MKVSDCGNLKATVGNQANKEAYVSRCLRDVIGRNEDLRLDGIVRKYEVCVRPIMTCFIETRADIAKTKRILRTTKVKDFRSIARKTEKKGVVPVCQQNGPSKIIPNSYSLNPLGKRPPGRLFKRWSDSWVYIPITSAELSIRFERSSRISLRPNIRGRRSFIKQSILYVCGAGRKVILLSKLEHQRLNIERRFEITLTKYNEMWMCLK